MKVLTDVAVPVRFKLFGLWTSVMFCYVYGDYFELYTPGKLQGMMGGNTGMGAVSQGALLGMSAMMAIPCLMGFLSLVLPAGLVRWLNVAFGVLFTAVMVLAVRGSWRFYVFFGVIEMVLTLTIVWFAWRWPRVGARQL